MINGSYSFGSNKIDLKKETSSFTNFSFDDLFKKTGIRHIYRTNENENTLTLAVDASKKILRNIDEKIESLIFITQSPVSLIPSSGSLLLKELNLSEECFVLDINQGC